MKSAKKLLILGFLFVAGTFSTATTSLCGQGCTAETSAFTDFARLDLQLGLTLPNSVTELIKEKVFLPLGVGFSLTFELSETIAITSTCECAPTRQCGCPTFFEPRIFGETQVEIQAKPATNRPQPPNPLDGSIRRVTSLISVPLGPAIETGKPSNCVASQPLTTGDSLRGSLNFAGFSAELLVFDVSLATTSVFFQANILCRCDGLKPSCPDRTPPSISQVPLSIFLPQATFTVQVTDPEAPATGIDAAAITITATPIPRGGANAAALAASILTRIIQKHVVAHDTIEATIVVDTGCDFGTPGCDLTNQDNLSIRVKAFVSDQEQCGRSTSSLVALETVPVHAPELEFLPPFERNESEDVAFNFVVKDKDGERVNGDLVDVFATVSPNTAGVVVPFKQTFALEGGITEKTFKKTFQPTLPGRTTALLEIQALDLARKRAITFVTFQTREGNVPPSLSILGPNSREFLAGDIVDLEMQIEDPDRDLNTCTISTFTGLNALSFESKLQSSFGFDFEYPGDAERNSVTFAYQVPHVTQPTTETITGTCFDGTDRETVDFELLILPRNTPPTAVDDTAAMNENIGDGASILIDVVANDIDPDNDPLLLINVHQGVNFFGILLIQDNRLQFTPYRGFAGIARLFYAVSDGRGGEDRGTVTITVHRVNNKPVAVDDESSLFKNTSLLIDVLANDFDPDGDPLQVVSLVFGSNTHATIAIEDKQVRYTPAPDFVGKGSFSYLVGDGRGQYAFAQVTVAVVLANRPPIVDLVNKFGTTRIPTGFQAQNAFEVTVSDPDAGDSVTCTITSQLGNRLIGSNPFTISGSIQTVFFHYDAQTGGADVVTVSCSDGEATSTATASIIANSVPLANSFTVTVVEDTTKVFFLDANDPERDPLEYFIQTQPQHGALSCDGTRCTYTPDLNFDEIDGFQYYARDNPPGVPLIDPGRSDLATVTLKIIKVNDLPFANPDNYATNEDTSLSVSVANGLLDNDSDLDGPVPTMTGFDVSRVQGAISVNLNGSFSYTPPLNFNGDETFTYTIQDNEGAQAIGTVTITVDAVNDAPTLTQSFSPVNVDEDAASDTVDLSSHFDDVDIATNGNSLSYSVTNTNSGLLNASVLGSTLTLDYLQNQNGTATLTVHATDSEGAFVPGTLNITVNAVNDPPRAVVTMITLNVSEDASSQTRNLASYFDDVDIATNGDSLSFLVTNDNTGLVSTMVSGSSLILDFLQDQSGTATLTVRATDLAGAFAQNTIKINVAAVNDAPNAVNDSRTIDRNSSISFDVVNNDTDVDNTNSQLTIISFTQPSSGTSGCAIGGRTCSFTPANNFTGNRSFLYTITDGSLTDTATVTITVRDPNRPPTIDDDSFRMDKNDTITEKVASDPDGDSITMTITGQGNKGTATPLSGGRIRYTHEDGFSGTDNVRIRVIDGNGGQATGTISIFIINQRPDANNDGDVFAAPGFVGTVDVLDNDDDPDGDPISVISANSNAPAAVSIIQLNPVLRFSVSSGAQSGTVTITYTIADNEFATDSARFDVVIFPLYIPTAENDEAVTYEDTPVVIDVLANDFDDEGDPIALESVNQPAFGTASINQDETITYTPNPDYFGQDAFTYTICDAGGLCDSATVTVTVHAVNDDPVAENDATTTDQDQPVSLQVLDNDTDVDGDPLTIDSFTQGGNGTVSCSDSTCNYTPDPLFWGTDIFSYTVVDGQRGWDDATVTVTVNATGGGAPEARVDVFDTDEDVAAVLPVLDNDEDPQDDPLTIDNVTQPAHGQATPNGDGTVTYTPNLNYNGPDTFSYSVCDPTPLCATAAVTVNVRAVNDPPVALDDSDSTDNNLTVTTMVLNNDHDVDGDFLAIIGFTQGIWGTVACTDSSCTYTPDPTFEGTDSYTYTVSDGQGGEATATVTLILNAANYRPVAEDDWATTDQGAPVIISVLDNDTDRDLDPLSLTVMSPPRWGTAQVNVDQTVTYTPNHGYSGDDYFLYRVCDPTNLCDQAKVTITINAHGGHQIPEINDDTAKSTEGLAVTIDVLGNDVPHGHELYVASYTQPTHGSVVCDPWQCTYTPEAGFVGQDAFTYTAGVVADPDWLASATVTIDVAAQQGGG